MSEGKGNKSDGPLKVPPSPELVRLLSLVRGCLQHPPTAANTAFITKTLDTIQTRIVTRCGQLMAEQPESAELQRRES